MTIKRAMRYLFVWQYTSGKLSALASIVTLSTVLSIKFHVTFPIVLALCIALVVVIGMFFRYSGWMAEELKYVNDIGDLHRKLDAIIRRLENDKA